MTLTSVAMSVLGFNFYYDKYQIKMIKGSLERFIRDAYFWGNVGLIIKKRKEEAERESRTGEGCLPSRKGRKSE